MTTDEEYRWCQDCGGACVRRGLLLLAVAVLLLTAGTCAPPVAWGQEPDPTPELPPLEDLELFPFTQAQAAEQLRRHDRHERWLEWRAGFALGAEDRRRLAAQVEETRRRKRLWDLLDNALTEGRDPDNRREDLQRLLFRLGETAYYTGRMPAPLPPGLPRRPPVVVSAGLR